MDRAGLDAARKLGIPIGGWCPAGRRAEDGPIPDRYPLTETESANYAVRTRFNVRDSDGTLILSRLPLSGGTRLTVRFAESGRKPCLIIDLDTPEKAAERFAEWVTGNRIRTLNIAGPRAGTQPNVYEVSVELLTALLRPLVADSRKAFEDL